MTRTLPIFAAALALCLGAPLTAQEAAPGLRATGLVEVRVAPDIARITLGVVAEDADADAAVAAMSGDMTAVLDRLTAAGVADRDIQTSGLRLSPVQDYDSGRDQPRITGYIAETLVTVTVRDLPEIGTVLDAVVTDGANRLDGLQFDLADRSEAEADARRAAVADATDKAEVFAEAAGVSLGRVTAILEQGYGGGGPMPMMDMARAESMAVPVAPGELTVTAEVTMSWDIHPAD